jgi:hypothetical protein
MERVKPYMISLGSTRFELFTAMFYCLVSTITNDSKLICKRKILLYSTTFRECLILFTSLIFTVVMEIHEFTHKSSSENVVRCQDRKADHLEYFSITEIICQARLTSTTLTRFEAFHHHFEHHVLSYTQQLIHTDRDAILLHLSKKTSPGTAAQQLRIRLIRQRARPPLILTNGTPPRTYIISMLRINQRQR